MKRKAETSGTNSTVPTDGFTLSQHVDSNVSTSTGPAATIDADTRQNLSVGGQFAGYIFMCNAKTKLDCFTYRVFGLPASRIEVVEKIKPNTKLFLFDFDVKVLYGPYVADSIGKLALEPYAFGGKFPAQVKFSISENCVPLPEAAFKDAIKENYLSKFKFKQDLSYEQVSKLVSLFRPIILRSPQQASLSFHSAARHDSSMNAFERSLHIQQVPGAVPNDVLRHPRYQYVQETPLLPLHSIANQRALARDGEIASDPHHPYIAYERYVSVRSHQPYHPDDPSFQQHYTHRRYVYAPQQGINPPVPSANSYYDQNKRLLPTISPPQFQARALSPAIQSSSPAAHWVTLAAGTQNPRDQSSAYNLSSSHGPGPSHGNLHNGSNYTEPGYGYHNQRYPGTHEAVAAPTEQPVYTHAAPTEQPVYAHVAPAKQPVYAHPRHLASTSSVYTQQSEGDLALAHTLQPGSGGVGAVNAYSYHDSSRSTGLSFGHGYQPHSGSHQTQPVTVHQEGINVHASKIPPAYGNQEYPNSQVSVPAGSADPNIASVYGYQNQRYTGYYQGAPITSGNVTSGLPVHAYEKHPAFASDNYAQSQAVLALPQT